MSRRWLAIATGLAMVLSTTAFAQDQAGSASPANSDETLTPNAPLPQSSPAPSPANPNETLTPNAPAPATPDQGPVPAGGAAGTETASAWMPSTGVIVAVGAAAVGAAVCLAVCGGSGSHTSSTTTTTPK